MTKRVTITDIARSVGVSAGTVHRALTGKPGVGEEVRAKIVSTAKECGYKPNHVASALKRKTLRVVAAFPGPMKSNSYFYPFIWQGVRDYLQEISDFNVEFLEIPYYEGINDQADELNAILDRYPGGIDGLITVGHVGVVGQRGEAAIRRFVDSGIPVMLACDELKGVKPFGVVLADYDITGRMMAEVLFSQIPSDGDVILLSGDHMLPPHAGVVEGFDAFVKENGIGNRVVKINGYRSMDDVRLRTEEALRGCKNPAAVCCVYARGSVMLADLVRSKGLIGKIKAIGSDIFEENIRNLRDGVLSSVVYKNPYRQAYLAARILMNFLIKGEKPSPDVQYVESIMVFRSNLAFYESGICRANL
ncbi:MAG: LacI family DNA-binding transcriptional regulator [Treponemataceae bacterium]